MKRTTTPARRLRRATASLTLAGIALAACGGSSDGASTSTVSSVAPKIVVTSVKGDKESQLFAAIYARVLEDAGYRVSRKDPVELDRAGYLAALAKGEINLVPDWTDDLIAYVYSLPGAPAASTTVVPSEPATTQAPVTVPASSTTVAGATTTTSASSSTVAGSSTTTSTPVVITNGRTSAEQVIAIRAALPEGVAIGEPTDGEDKPVIACTEATVKANKDTEFVGLFNLASVAPTIRLGGSASWKADDQFGYPALETYYGGQFKDVLTIEDADLAKAIDGDTVDCVAVNSLDPIITTKRLTILVDDKAMVRGNALVPVLSTSVATQDLIAVLTQVNAALSSTKINQMLNQINAGGTDPVTVANAFLDTQGALAPATSVGG
jgi:glycine betaine/choline ABC-type transport system substrate-binding protein